MRKSLAFIILSCLIFTAYGQRCLTSEGEVFAYGISRTGVVPEALQQLVGRRSWQVLDEVTIHRAPSRACRKGQLAFGSQTIGPLLHSIRDQEAPYNNLCPYWTYSNGHVSTERCLSGCVATAIEQVLAYYRYPEVLKDTLHGWETDNYAIQDMLPGTRFDWNNYLLDYRDGWTEAQGQAIALPTLAAGMAVHMNYGLSSSGADTENAIEPLKQAFGYGMARYYERLLYTPERWHALLQYELQQGRPIVYTGYTMGMDGHAFNIDGVDAQGFYHVNWGYNGRYDGWYDLDWLCPWETSDFNSQEFVLGFFCNQDALFMHPSADAHPLEPDVMDIDNLGVILKEVAFLRQPDLQGYVAADFCFENTGEETVTYTYEVMTNLPTDTEPFEQADYVGLAGLTLQPQETRVQRVYLHFSTAGERILGISHDDITIPFKMPVTILKGTPPQLEWEHDVDVDVEVCDDGTYTATLTVGVRNHATSGYAGDNVTYSLFTDEPDAEQMRHYFPLALPGGERQTYSITYSGLVPETHYNFNVRCPWKIQVEADFYTPKATGIDVPDTFSPASTTPTYDLSGRSVGINSRGIIVRRGHKILQR